MEKKKVSISEKRDRLLGFITAMPAMILLFIFTVYPVFYLLYYSMFSGSLISTKKKFVGLDNYAELWASETFHKVLVNTVVYTVLFVGGLDPQVWRKVYRAHLWENVRFPEDVLYEDLYVNSEVLLNAKKLIATDQVLYDNNYYNEKSVSALEKEPRILHELKAWMHNLNLARKIPVLSAYREYYRWQALRCWAKCNGTLGEDMFQGNSAIYDVLFTALPLADAIRPAPQSDRNTLLYYMAEVEAMTLAITMLKQCGLECHHEVRDMFQAAVPALCIDSIMHILRPASRELLLCAIEEARRYKRRLNFGQRFMMAMIGKGPKDVLELKGRQYLKRGISK